MRYLGVEMLLMVIIELVTMVIKATMVLFVLMGAMVLNLRPVDFEPHLQMCDVINSIIGCIFENTLIPRLI